MMTIDSYKKTIEIHTVGTVPYYNEKIVKQYIYADKIIEGAIQNGKSGDRGIIGHTTQNKEKQTNKHNTES